MKRLSTALVALATTLLITACGSDSGSGGSASTEAQAPAAAEQAPESTSIEEGPVAGSDVPKLDVRKASDPTGLLRYEMTRLNGEPDDISQYAGKVVLVVNTASECGFTPQFEGLQSLYDEKKGDGFVILGFPSNDFAGQEPRSDKEIATFCKANFGVKFPMFAKSDVLGPDVNPLFATLPEPEWNFNKYLLDRNGELVANWGSTTTPESAELRDAIDAQL